MSHAVHAHYFGSVIDLINDPIVSYANSPIAIRAAEFPATRRTRVLRQFLKYDDYSIVEL
jgi:hypothetical protein